MVRMTTTMSIKIDDNLKRQAQQTAAQIGIPLSTLVNAYLRDVVATGRVEFSAAEPMTPQMERIIERAEKERKNGEVSPSFASVEEFQKWLDDPESTWQNGRKIREDLR